MTVRSFRRVVTRLAATLALTAAAASHAGAQTLQLTDSNDTVVRGGTFANTNLGNDLKLATRASTNLEYVRRILLKFDTQNPIPANTPIASATLTLTVAGGNSEIRTLTAYRIKTSYEESQATWSKRNSSTSWSTSGGDLGEIVARAPVTNVVGSQVTMDVTAFVQNVVNGKFGSSRYSRIALVDAGSSTSNSYKEYSSGETADTTVRPRLVVVLGTTSTVTPDPEPAPTPTASTTVKFLHWNIQHGVGTDGVYNIDRIATWIAKTGATVVSLNEVERNVSSWGNEDQPARFASLLKAKTGKTWYYHFASKTGSSNGQGNLLLSIYPIDGKASYLLSHTRSVAQIRITVNGRTLNLFSTHLDADYSSRRATQMTQLKTWMATFPEARIIGGDFNTSPTQGEIGSMTGTYYDVWASAVSAGMAVAYSGNTAGNTRNGRIDYIFQSKAATTVVIKGAQVFDVRDSSGVMPSDHRPLLATLEVR